MMDKSDYIHYRSSIIRITTDILSIFEKHLDLKKLLPNLYKITVFNNEHSSLPIAGLLTDKIGELTSDDFPKKVITWESFFNEEHIKHANEFLKLLKDSEIGVFNNQMKFVAKDKYKVKLQFYALKELDIIKENTAWKHYNEVLTDISIGYSYSESGSSKIKEDHDKAYSELFQEKIKSIIQKS
jgi:hypothetical protein